MNSRDYDDHFSRPGGWPRQVPAAAIVTTAARPRQPTTGTPQPEITARSASPTPSRQPSQHQHSSPAPRDPTGPSAGNRPPANPPRPSPKGDPGRPPHNAAYRGSGLGVEATMGSGPGPPKARAGGQYTTPQDRPSLDGNKPPANEYSYTKPSGGPGTSGKAAAGHTRDSGRSVSQPRSSAARAAQYVPSSGIPVRRQPSARKKEEEASQLAPNTLSDGSWLPSADEDQGALYPWELPSEPEEPAPDHAQSPAGWSPKNQSNPWSDDQYGQQIRKQPRNTAPKQGADEVPSPTISHSAAQRQGGRDGTRESAVEHGFGKSGHGRAGRGVPEGPVSPAYQSRNEPLERDGSFDKGGHARAGRSGTEIPASPVNHARNEPLERVDMLVPRASSGRHKPWSKSGGGDDGGYLGPGISMTTTAAKTQNSISAEEAEILRDENARLKDEVEHLKKVLEAMGSKNSSSASGGRQLQASNSEGAGRAGRHAALSGEDAGGIGLADGQLTSLAQYKAQIVQLQRQLLVMDNEMKARGKVVMEAESILLEAKGKLKALASLDASDPASAAVLSGSQFIALHRWSAEMLNRMRSTRGQSAQAISRQGMEAERWSEGEAARKWEIPFVAAGGNPFLSRSSTEPLTVVGAATGKGLLITDPDATHSLELRLAELAPKLGQLAIALRCTILPAMPWMGEEKQKLQSDIAEIAQAVAGASGSLTQLCAALPASHVIFGDAAVAARPREKAEEVYAGRDSWLWSTGGAEDEASKDPSSQAENGKLSQLDVQRLAQTIAPLLKDPKAGIKPLNEILGRVTQWLEVANRQRGLLEAELAQCCRMTAKAAGAVQDIRSAAADALRDALGTKDDALIRDHFATAASLQRLSDAADDFDAAPNEERLAQLVAAVRAGGSQLRRAPEMLRSSPVVDVEGFMLSRLGTLQTAFEQALNPSSSYQYNTGATGIETGSPALKSVKHNMHDAGEVEDRAPSVRQHVGAGGTKRGGPPGKGSARASSISQQEAYGDEGWNTSASVAISKGSESASTTENSLQRSKPKARPSPARSEWQD